MILRSSISAPLFVPFGTVFEIIPQGRAVVNRSLPDTQKIPSALAGGIRKTVTVTAACSAVAVLVFDPVM